MIEHAPPQTRPASPAVTRWMPLLCGLAILGLAMTATATVAPDIAHRVSGADHPDYGVIAGTGLAMIVLSSAFLAFASRIVGLGAAWLTLALLSNALVLAAKFVLAPVALYNVTFTQWWVPSFNPYFGAVMFIAYAAVIGIVYAIARMRVTRALGQAPPMSSLVVGVIVALIAIACVLSSEILLVEAFNLLLYGIVVTVATVGGAILVMLGALAAGSGAGWAAAGRSISFRNIGILTSAFWLALSMVLVYHVVWVVFMTILIGIWPLKTVAPSGK